MNQTINRHKQHFWSIIDEAREKAGTWEDMLEPLVDSLSQLEVPDILKWQQIFNEYQQLSYKNKLWAAAYVIMGGCSDDSFDYFRAWLTAQGREVFMAALLDPDSLADLDCSGENFECMLDAAAQAYFKKLNISADHERFYRELDTYPLSDTEKTAITSEISYAEDIDAEWDDEDEASLAEWLPQLAEKFLDDSSEPGGILTYFCPMDEHAIADFAAGTINGKQLMEIICASPHLRSFDNLEGIEYILTGFGKDSAYEEVTEGGEIVAGPDGEAFIQVSITVTRADGYQYMICQPMVFKTPDEVKSICELLRPIDEKTFTHKGNVKKLIKSGYFDASSLADGYDKRTVKKEAPSIVGELWGEFERLREFYYEAEKLRKGVVVFMGFVGREADEEG